MKKEIIIANYESGANIRCMMRRIGSLPAHVHDLFEIGMILEGSCSLTVGDDSCVLHEDDVFSVEGRTPHSILANECTLLTVQFNQYFFERALPEPKHPDFSCNSAVSGDGPAYEQLRHMIASLIWNNTYRNSGYELRNMSIIFQIMDVMYQNFRVEDSEARNRRTHRYTSRMMEITGIINEQYQTNLTLGDLAERIHLSAPYLSKFFERQFGMTFLNYLAKVRLNHAVNELVNTGDTIEMISANAGFPNSSAFVKAFKKEYGVLPSIYRRRQQDAQGPAPVTVLVEQHDHMARLKKYLDEPPRSLPQSGCSCYAGVSYESSAGTLRHTWRKMLGISRASSLLISDIQELLRRVRRELGISFLKFNGIFSDDMHVFSIRSNGTPSYSFSYVDRALDFLLSIGMKPLIQLGFMPKELAKEDRQILGNVISAPKSNSQWCELVEALLIHLQERYGRAELRQWMFSVWEDPNVIYRFSDNETFYRFYRDTRRTVKSCDPEIVFGMPAVPGMIYPGRDSWYIPFLQWCASHNCLPDFLNMHFYDLIPTGADRGQEAFGFFETMMLRDTPDGFSSFVRQFRQECKKFGLESIPAYISEWNNTPSQQDLLNDTCFRSCYLVKNLLENYDVFESFSFWALTDWMGESPVPDEMFFGGIGLFTSSGIPKACYYALTLLGRLGDTLLGKGEGWFITRQGRKIQIILYHYRHFSSLYAQGERFDMTFQERYTPFGPEQLMDAHLTIHGIPDGEYHITENSVSRRFGSSFDQWVRMGAVELHAPHEQELLNSLSVPGLNKYTAKAQNGSLRIDAMLDLLEVRLITAEPVSGSPA